MLPSEEEVIPVPLEAKGVNGRAGVEEELLEARICWS
jgi:hypothetical protein